MPRKRRPGAASLRSASPLGDAGAGVRLGPFSRHTLDTPLISQSRLGNVESSLQRVPLGAHMREWQERGMCAWKAHAPEAAAAPPAAGKRVQWKRGSASMLGRDTRQCSSQRGIRVTGHRLPSTKLPDGPGEGHGSSPDPCPGRAPALHEANFFHPLHKYWRRHRSRRGGGC